MFVPLQLNRSQTFLGQFSYRSVARLAGGVTIDRAIGLAMMLVAVRLMTSLLFGVSAIDPVAYAGVAAGLIGAALLACYVPAARAAALNPIDALRAD